MELYYKKLMQVVEKGTKDVYDITKKLNMSLTFIVLMCVNLDKLGYLDMVSMELTITGKSCMNKWRDIK